MHIARRSLNTMAVSSRAPAMTVRTNKPVQLEPRWLNGLMCALHRGFSHQGCAKQTGTPCTSFCIDFSAHKRLPRSCMQK